MTTYAFFDDYQAPVLGHHPDLLLGLAGASRTGADPASHTRIYCPPAYMNGQRLAEGVVHMPWTGLVSDSQESRQQHLAALCRDALVNGVDCLVNLFLDENFEVFAPLPRGLRFVQALHRPAEFEGNVRRRMPAAGPGQVSSVLGRIAPADLFVVHTRAAEAYASRWLPAERLVRVGWPAASVSELTARFGRFTALADEEPYVLLIGDARPAKGVDDLMLALEGGPPLRVVGQQPEGFEESLRERYPRTRVVWETGRVPRQRLEQAIAGAAVVAFPYLEEFGRHGGVSGALGQALTFGKPIVASTVLADQLPESGACQLIEPGARLALRAALKRVLQDPVQWHKAASDAFDHVRREHTYEMHLARITERLPARDPEAGGVRCWAQS